MHLYEETRCSRSGLDFYDVFWVDPVRTNVSTSIVLRVRHVQGNVGDYHLDGFFRLWKYAGRAPCGAIQ
jgi:hypothetical protein